MTEPDLALDLLSGDRAGVETFGQQRVEIGFLPLIGMARVIGCELAHERQREVQQAPLLEREIDRQPGLPRLRPPLRVVEQLGGGRQMVEIVPLRLEQADCVETLEPEVDPVEIIDAMRPQLIELLGKPPVRQPGAIEQHDRGRQRIGELVIAGPRTAPDRLALEIAREQLPDVSDRENVGIGDQSQAFVAEEVGDGEAQRREGLQIVRVPRALMAAAKQGSAVRLELRILACAEDSNVECAAVAAVAPETVRRNQRAQHLLVVGVDDDGRLHRGHM